MSAWVTLAHADGSRFNAWHAPAADTAESNPKLGLVMLPEVYNINAWAQSAAQRFASEGAEVLLLDLYWRRGAGLHFDYAQAEPARALGASVQTQQVQADVGVAVQWLQQRLGDDARIATLGYCLGGRLALLTRNVPGIQGAVSYYGVNLDQHTQDLTASTTPALLHFGDQDPWIPNSTVQTLQTLAQAQPEHLHVQVHAGAGHGFARTGHPPWHHAADQQAHRASLDFLQKIHCCA